MAANDSQLTEKLLTAGVLGGPLFIVLSLVQAFTREGFDWVRHPASLLSLGSLGFIQIANFVITGALFIACGVGLKRVLTTGAGKKWVPRLFVLVGVAFYSRRRFRGRPCHGFPARDTPGNAIEDKLSFNDSWSRPNNWFLSHVRRFIDRRPPVVETGATRSHRSFCFGCDRCFRA